MSILTRYLIKAHLSPLLFALSVLTSLLFLNAVAQRMEDLVGKGLGWRVIGEFMLLSLPHTVALTLPMSVLVAVLYAFSQLTAANEFTAMSAGGVRPARILIPLLGGGAILAGVVLMFNDRVLPEANHRLKNLLVDISGKSPTFQLREQVVNEVQTADGSTRYYLQARAIDPISSELEDVAIFDVSDGTRHRTIYATHGTMAFNEARTDLFLTLFDGTIFEVSEDRPGGFQQLAFNKQIIPLRGVSDVLERRGGDQRSDREMPISMLAAEVDSTRAELAAVRQESLSRARYAIREALGLEQLEGDEIDEILLGRARVSEQQRIAEMGLLPVDDMSEAIALNTRTNATREELLELTVARLRVEIHKKWAIAVACFVFVLVGAPIAVRFPRGGVGMVIVVSVAIIAVYWTSLIGGENLADRGRVDPVVAMWFSNFVFLLLGLWLASRMGKEVSTSRGGGWDDFKHTIGNWLRRPLGAPRRRLDRQEVGA